MINKLRGLNKFGEPIRSNSDIISMIIMFALALFLWFMVYLWVKDSGFEFENILLIFLAIATTVMAILIIV